MSRARFPMGSLDFLFSFLQPSSPIMALGFTCTQALIGMSISNSPMGGRVKLWSARKATNVTAICELITKKMWDPRRLIILWGTH